MTTRRALVFSLLAVLVAPLLAACVVVGSAPDPGAPEPVPAPDVGELPTVPLRVLEAPGATLALVPVTIAGQGPYLFALDTGASSTVLDTTIADELGLQRTGEQREVSGVIGQQRVELVHVEQWQLGDVDLGATDIALLDLPSPTRGDGLQGLLGSDVLSNFDYVVVDYDDRRLGLAPRS
jgi:predicted aspartyl protease